MKFKREHVQRIKELERNGRITARQVVDDAKRPASPLHTLFNWNIEEAAEESWLAKAREILSQIRVVIHSETLTIRYPRYIKDPSLPQQTQGYLTTESLRDDPEMAIQALTDECSRILGCLKRARSIAVAVGQESVFDELLEQVTGVLLSIEKMAA